MSLRKFTAALAVAAVLSANASAATIVQYATAGGVNPLPAFFADAAVSADGLTAGSGLNVQNFSTFNTTGWDVASTSFADAVAADDVWTWGFDVTGSTPLDLTTMDFRLDRSGTGPDDVEIEVSVNGGAGIPVFFHDYNDSGAGVNFVGVDLSGVPTLVSGDSVVFTLGAYNSESAAGSLDLETITFPGGTDSLTIFGEFVPEPTSFVMLSLGAMGLGFVRRR
ncbi:MAG: PEP-CTERM sorting domain-containing protein [Planctomycetota bacterium]